MDACTAHQNVWQESAPGPNGPKAAAPGMMVANHHAMDAKSVEVAQRPLHRTESAVEVEAQAVT